MRTRFFLCLVLLATTALLRGQSADELRGERVGWARLKTESQLWFRHSTGDPVLMRFLREQTSLNIHCRAWPSRPASPR